MRKFDYLDVASFIVLAFLLVLLGLVIGAGVSEGFDKIGSLPDYLSGFGTLFLAGAAFVGYREYRSQVHYGSSFKKAEELNRIIHETNISEFIENWESLSVSTKKYLDQLNMGFKKFKSMQYILEYDTKKIKDITIYLNKDLNNFNEFSLVGNYLLNISPELSVLCSQFHCKAKSLNAKLYNANSFFNFTDDIFLLEEEGDFNPYLEFINSSIKYEKNDSYDFVFQNKLARDKELKDFQDDWENIKLKLEKLISGQF